MTATERPTDRRGAPVRLLAAVLLLAALAACAAPVAGPAGQPSSSNVNPETGSRGGSGASS